MAVPTISIVRAESLENGYARFVVRLSAPTSDEVRIDYRGIEGTARNAPLNAQDFTVSRGVPSLYGLDTLVIPAGQTEAEIVVRVRHDYEDEADESFWLELYNPKGAAFAGNPAVLRSLGVAKDNDGTGSNLALFVSSPTVVEGHGGNRKAIFEVHISEAQASDMTFSYRTVDGSARAGSDYLAKQGTVKIGAGETTATVAIDLVEDTVAEINEFFSLLVTPNSAIRNGFSGSSGVASVLDDDTSKSQPVISIERADQTEGGTMLFRVVLSRATDDEVRIDYRTLVGSAADAPPNSRDFTPETGALVIAAGSRVGFISVRVRQDYLDEVDESVWLELSSPTNARFAGNHKVERVLGVVHDNNGTGSNLSAFVSSPTVYEGDNGDRKAVFEIHLSQAHEKNLTFAFRTADITAKNGSDYIGKTGTVTILAGQTVAAVTVDLVEDQRLEGDETFSLIVTPPSGGVIKNVVTAGRATIANDDDIHEVIFGNAANNYLSGGSGDDRIFGYGGNDTLLGGTGKDRMDGGSGRDKLDGGTGNDKLFGGSGNDTLIGGAGHDKLGGGAGRDTFLFRAIGDSTAKSEGRDKIADFTRGQDKVDLTLIDAKTGAAGNNAFVFIGRDAFDKKAGELRYEHKNGDTLVAADVNGDGKADFAIVLKGTLNLTGSDFLL